MCILGWFVLIKVNWGVFICVLDAYDISKKKFCLVDLTYNTTSLCQKIESILYQAALAITGAIHETSQTKLYNELGTESMKLRQWSRHLCYFFKIQSSGLPQYLKDLIPKPSLRYSTHFSPLPNFKIRTELFKNSFFPYTVNEWNNLDNIIKSSESYLMFRKRMLIW